MSEVPRRWWVALDRNGATVGTFDYNPTLWLNEAKVITVVPLSALEKAEQERDEAWNANIKYQHVVCPVHADIEADLAAANARVEGLEAALEAAERERDEAEEHIRQFHSAAAKTRIEKLERNASELELLRQAATEWEDCTQSYIARIEKLEAALHTATELLRGISEENLAMSTPSLVAADAFLAALDEEGEK